MNYIKTLAAVAVLLTPSAYGCMPPALLSQQFNVEGRATTLAGEHLYTERLNHKSDDEGGKLKVDYSGPEGKTFALKTVNYGCNPTAPSFELKDMSSGIVEGVRWGDDGVQAFQGSDSTKLDMPSGPVIVDAGFDNAIKLSWDKMMNGEKVAYKYLFARDKRFLKLRFVKSDPPQLPNQKFDDGLVFFKVVANNLIFRLLSSPIYVGYEKTTKELKYYFGPSNLPTMKNQKAVLISYQTLGDTG